MRADHSWPGVNALAGMRVNRPATWSPRGPASMAPRSKPIPEYTKVAGSLSEKYFRVSDASAPARVVMSRLCSKVDDDHGHAGIQADTAYLLDHVGDVGPAGNRQAEEPGDLRRDHLAGRGRRDGDVDDGDVVAGARVPLPVHELGGLAELGDGRGLPGPGRPGHHEPRPAGNGALAAPRRAQPACRPRARASPARRAGAGSTARPR